MSDSQRPNITLYTDTTPNGYKISMVLEELGLPYKVEHINISTNRQKEPWFLAINPNGRIPALTDTFADGRQICLFESGSIMQYLTEQYDAEHKISFAAGSREHYDVNSWLFFQNAGVGPMQGQAHHFVRYAPVQIEYAQNRYVNETRRLYGVLDAHLAASSSGFLVGDHLSTADIANVAWVMYAGWANVDIDEFPHVKKWEETLYARPAIKKGCDVPKPIKIKQLLKDKEAMDRTAKQASQWIVQGMQSDAKK